MSCLQTLAGLARDCAKNMGGIDKVWLANFDDVTAITITENKVSAITMATGTGSTTAKFKLYRMRRGAANMTSTLNVDAVAGTSFVGTDLVMQFNKMETAKRVEMNALAQGELRVIVKDNNGTYWMLGADNAVVAGAGDGQTGTAMGDGNRYTLTLHEDGADFPVEILASVITDTLVDALA